MTASPELFRHFPTLRHRLPWTPLARPTPVQPLERLAARVGGPALWIKRDDRTSDLVGGCAPRELEFLFGAVLRGGAQRVLAFGHVGSQRCLALAAFARHFDLEPVLALSGGATDATTQAMLQSAHALGADLHRLDAGPLALARLLRSSAFGAGRQGGSRLPHVVWPRQAAVWGALGAVNAVFELQRQIRCGILREPERIYVGTDSLPTVAGLAVGCELAGYRTIVVGVGTDRNRRQAERLARRTLGFLRRRVRDLPARSLSAARIVFRSPENAPTPHQAAALLQELEGLELHTGASTIAIATLLGDCSRGQLRESGLFWRADAPPTHPPLPAVDKQSRAYREFFVPS